MNEIEPGLWVGDLIDGRLAASDEGWAPICVLEDDPVGVTYDTDEFAVRIPVLTKDETGRKVALAQTLDSLADRIDEARATGKKVLVFCFAGQERSPLTLTWYLHRRKGMTLMQAFTHVQIRRQVAANRLHWIRWT